MSRYTVELQPFSVNGTAVCKVNVIDADTGSNVYSDTQDLSKEFIRHKVIKKLLHRKYIDETYEQMEIKILDVLAEYDAKIAQAEAIRDPPPQFTIRQLIQSHPHLHEPIIDGLLRDRETLNIISVTKIGKSWLLYSLLLSIATGREWLGRFRTRQGRVLLIDNELHRPTIAHRLQAVATAMEIPFDEWADMIDVWPIRGAGLDIDGIALCMQQRTTSPYILIAIDAKYRAMPARASENDNAAETKFYNTIDRLADQLNAAIVNVHHSSKGLQGDKRVTDVGSGAGAQSRAADTHLILREHELENCVVLDAAVRSFPPIDPLGLTWKFPLWVPDDIDTRKLKGAGSKEEQQRRNDDEADDEILSVCANWKTRREIRTLTGFGENRTNRAIARLVKNRLLEAGKQDRYRNPDAEVFKTRQN